MAGGVSGNPRQYDSDSLEFRATINRQGSLL